MKNKIIDQLEEILELPGQEFDKMYRKPAFQKTKEVFGSKAFLTGILALGNYCINDCRYCGLRSESSAKRFRLTPAQLKAGVDYLESMNIKRLFLISGEDPNRSFNEITDIISYARAKGFYISIGAGVFGKPQLEELYRAGAQEFCMKFETSNRKIFRKVKPSSDF